MPFEDDVREREPESGSVLYRCRRCGSSFTEGPHADVATALRRALSSAPTVVHGCPPAHSLAGGALGVAEIIGTSERPSPEARP